jgi:hypothetical protein
MAAVGAESCRLIIVILPKGVGSKYVLMQNDADRPQQNPAKPTDLIVEMRALGG